MAQFYFLSVLFNIIAGLIFIYGRNLVSYETESASDTYVSDDFADFESPSDTEEIKALEDTSKAEVKDDVLADFAILNNQTFRFVLGILAAFVGLMKLLSPMGVVFFGDLLPAAAGFVCGFSLLLEYYENSASDSVIPDKLQNIFIDSRRYIGIVSVAVGILHFILPRVLFL